jgi:hypothetical protein
MTIDTYLDRVARCRVPGRMMTLKKRLTALKAEAAEIRAELARLQRVAEAVTEGQAA